MSRVDVDGVGIEYEVTGEGRPVVLLHGFPDSGRLWRHQVPALAGAGFQVIVPDLRGYVGHRGRRRPRLPRRPGTPHPYRSGWSTPTWPGCRQPPHTTPASSAPSSASPGWSRAP